MVREAKEDTCMHNARHTDTSIKCPVTLQFWENIVSSERSEKSVIRKALHAHWRESECIQFVGTIYQEFFLHLWGWFQLMERLAMATKARL